MKAKYKIAFLAACIADISACSAITPLDDYVTTHNLYGNLCKEMSIVERETADALRECQTGENANLNEGSIQHEKSEEENQEEAL